jgi:hypothetical protein
MTQDCNIATTNNAAQIPKKDKHPTLTKKNGFMNLKGSRKNNYPFLSADASCLVALRKLEIS